MYAKKVFMNSDPVFGKGGVRIFQKLFWQMSFRSKVIIQQKGQ
jgi:hypothetical protein